MKMDEKTALVESLFTSFSDDDICRFASAGKFHIVEDSSILFYAGDASKDIMFVLSGSCTLFLDNDTVLHSVQKGIVATPANFSDFEIEYSFNVEAQKGSVLFSINFDDLKKIVGDDFNKLSFFMDMILHSKAKLE